MVIIKPSPHRWRRTFLPVLAALVALVETFVAQSTPPKPIKIDVGLDIAAPASKVSVPIVLDVPEGVEVGQTINTITFPNDVVSYVEVTLGDSAKEAEATAEATAAVIRADPKKSILTVRITAIKGPLHTGTLASVVFTVAKTAKDGSVPLRNAPQAFAFKGSSTPMAGVQGADGEIKVGAPPVISCFFYMH